MMGWSGWDDFLSLYLRFVSYFTSFVIHTHVFTGRRPRRPRRWRRGAKAKWGRKRCTTGMGMMGMMGMAAERGARRRRRTKRRRKRTINDLINSIRERSIISKSKIKARCVDMTCLFDGGKATHQTTTSVKPLCVRVEPTTALSVVVDCLLLGFFLFYEGARAAPPHTPRLRRRPDRHSQTRQSIPRQCRPPAAASSHHPTPSSTHALRETKGPAMGSRKRSRRPVPLPATRSTNSRMSPCEKV